MRHARPRASRNLIALAASVATLFAVSLPAQNIRIPRTRMPFTDPVAPEIPATVAAQDFPLRVHLVFALWNGYGPNYHGFGGGNLLTSSAPQGFDYTFDCSVPFVPNTVGETYQARWKKQDFRLQILLARIGSDHQDTCTLDLVLKPQPFSSSTNVPARKWRNPMASPAWQPPNLVYSEPDDDYPVQFHVVTDTRTSAGSGNGTANILGGPTSATRGYRFSYICTAGFAANTQVQDYFQGHWLKPDRKLEILTQRPGSDHVDRCTVSLTPSDTPYPDPVDTSKR